MTQRRVAPGGRARGIARAAGWARALTHGGIAPTRPLARRVRPAAMGFPFSCLVVWGGRRDAHSHAHIHRHFVDAARKLSIPALWVDDAPASNAAIQPGMVVLAADVWSRHIQARPGASYVLHNLGASHPLCRSLEAAPERHLRLQVWTDAASGERWGPVRSFDREDHTLYQPWGTNLLAEEFLEPVANLGSREAAFVGSIWSDSSAEGELGNVHAIDELRRALAERGLAFRHLTGVSDRANVRAVRRARLAPAIAGQWQVRHDYLPCRVFKNVSYGQFALTNVPAVNRLLDGFGLRGETVCDLIEEGLALRADEAAELVREQQRIVSGYTYRSSLEAVARAFEELSG